MRDIKNRIKRKNGFSLIELLIGLVILAFGVLAIAGMQINSIKGGFFSNNVTKATVSAQSKLEELKRLAFNDANLSGGEHNEGTIPNSIFTRRYHVQDTTPTLKTILVSVQWLDKGDHNVSLSTLRSK